MEERHPLYMKLPPPRCALFRKNRWLENRPGLATRLEVEGKEPSVRHTVTVQQIQKWTESIAVTPGSPAAEGAGAEVLNP